jgi:hypothetical protein
VAKASDPAFGSVSGAYRYHMITGMMTEVRYPEII